MLQVHTMETLLQMRNIIIVASGSRWNQILRVATGIVRQRWEMLVSCEHVRVLARDLCHS